MATTLDLPYPPRWINAYVFDKLCDYENIGVSRNQDVMPIFATSPTSIEETYQKIQQLAVVDQPLLIQYDRLMRFRPSAFYPHKREQILYYIYSTSLQNVNNATVVISQVLDREDAAAQDVNAWCSANPQEYKGDSIPQNVFFRNIKVYQIDEVRDYQRPISNNTLYVSKMIVEYDYHADTPYK